MPTARLRPVAPAPSANGGTAQPAPYKTQRLPSGELIKGKIASALLPLAVPLDALTLDPNNARLHPEESVEVLKKSFAKYGQKKCIVVNARGMIVVAGNGTVEALRELGWTHVAANVEEMDDNEARNYGLDDNKTAEASRWDLKAVAALEALSAELGDAPVGWTADELAAIRAGLGEATAPPAIPAPTLSDRFIVPPFSVLDARQGYWQDRKRQWLALGIQSELGRGEGVHEYGEIAVISRQGGTIETDDAKAKNNGLLGESEQARSHYRNASPGESPGAATQLKNGKTQRGDGAGRPLARTFGSGAPGDLAAGFKAKTLGAVAPNERGPDGILTRGGKYSRPDPRAIKDHAWLATHGKKIPQAGRADASPYNCYAYADETSRRNAAAQPQSGTSIFDPVLCELAYRWFSPPGGAVLDPFAGGSVRGIVAAVLGRGYTGVDLSERQLEANRAQQALICPRAQRLKWHAGDSQNIGKLASGKYDLVFSCPPYADLEVYSDDPRDLSTMGFDEFCDVYARIIKATVAMLKPDRFACFVVGDLRDERGLYRNFPALTTAAFAAAGAALYNEAVLVTAVGSLPIRVGKQFSVSRKLGKTHQNVLVYCKGCPRKATAACGEVETADLEEMFAEQLAAEAANG